MEQQTEQGKIIRKVTKIGNGAHLFAPKEWIGEEVILVRTPKLDIKKQILKIIYPYLENIIAVFLYGSYARQESSPESDIDILIIADKKFKIEKQNKFDIIVLEKDKIEKAIKINPILLYSIFREAKPLINSNMLQILKEQKINKKYFKEFLDSSKRILKIDKEFIELDKLDGEILESESVAYSLILRLRGIFIINQLLKKQKYSNKLFKKWLKTNFKKLEYEKIYNIYRAIRDNKKIISNIKINQVEPLIKILEDELKKLENQIKNG